MMRSRIRPGAVLLAATLASAHAASPAALEEPQVSAAVAACLDQVTNTDGMRLLTTAITVCWFALDSKTLLPAERARALEQRGVAHRHAKMLDKSLADLTAAKALDPNEASIARMLESRKRESCTYGSEGGGSDKLSLPLS